MHGYGIVVERKAHTDALPVKPTTGLMFTSKKTAEFNVILTKNDNPFAVLKHKFC